jgi:hypothetical protein
MVRSPLRLKKSIYGDRVAISTMKFTASVINQLRPAPSVQGRIRPSYEFVSLAEETATGSPLDHGNGIPPFQQWWYDFVGCGSSTLRVQQMPLLPQGEPHYDSEDRLMETTRHSINLFSFATRIEQVGSDKPIEVRLSHNSAVL